MKVDKFFDKSGVLIATHFHGAPLNGRHFITNNDSELQVGVFQLNADVDIARHWHPPQRRIISSTQEVLVLFSGIIQANLYNSDFSPNCTLELEPFSILSLHSGGHSFRMITEAYFVEVKQGPYVNNFDKELF